jgi:hypothetical protein
LSRFGFEVDFGFELVCGMRVAVEEESSLVGVVQVVVQVVV